MRTTYTVEQIMPPPYPYPEDLLPYMIDIGPGLAALFGNKLDWRNFPLQKITENYIFLVCRRNGKISGHMICHLGVSPLDTQVKVLRQISLYAKTDPGSRTAYHLFQKFLDIGKDRANHIITQLASHSNIKPSTLKKIGFEEVETVYRLETS